MTHSNFDFSAVLASTVHDMKNSLGMLLQSVEKLIGDVPLETDDQKKHFSSFHYEAARVNSSLVQLLSLYKLGADQLVLNVNEFNVSEFLEYQALLHNTLLEVKGIHLDEACDEDLQWVFDEHLIEGVIANVITNSIRYTHDRIRLTAWEDMTGLVIQIEDNGPGYPQAMLDEQGDYIKSVNFSTGSTGLGLYFSANIAAMHTFRKKEGSIQLSNGGELGGGVFRILLP